MQLSTDAGVANSTVHGMISGKSFPRWGSLKAVLGALGIEDADQMKAWKGAYRRVAKKRETKQGPAGAIRVDAADGLLLGVHPAITVPGADAGTLPTYVRRDTDTNPGGVRETINSLAAEGGFVLLVGGSSVGKTRCLYEAVRALSPDWWLTQPGTSKDIMDLVGAVSSGADLVVWLDELQGFLEGERGLTAATVRDLLCGTGRVLLVGTLRPEYHSAYIALPDRDKSDRYAVERAVVQLARVVRLEGFTAAERQRARDLADRDPRIHAALQVSDYGFTETMAAAPQLIARWRDAGPYAAAVMNAALDAARFGVWHALPAELLRAAAPGYCDDRVRARALNNWFEDALAYAGTMVHGAAAPLAPVAGRGMGQVDGYRPADYLLQYAGQVRVEQIGPPELWDALADHVTDWGDLDRLAMTARILCLDRLSARLKKRAVLLGDPAAPAGLLNLLQFLDCDGLEDAAAWVVDHVDRVDHAVLGDLDCIAELVKTLGALGVAKPRIELAGRAARLASVEDASAVARCLKAFRDAGANEAVLVLADRAARHALVEDVQVARELWKAMDQVGAEQARVTVIERASRQIALHPHSTGDLLDEMNAIGTGVEEARQALIRRVSHHAPVEDPFDVRWLLDIMLERVTGEAIRVLAERAAEQSSVDNPFNVAPLLEAMDRIGAGDAVARLATRAAHYATLEDQLIVTGKGGIDRLLLVMKQVGADEAAQVLAGRAATDTPLTTPNIVGDLLEAMKALGADAAIQVLIDRTANYTPDDPFLYSWFLGALHRSGAGEAVSALAERAALMPIDNPQAVAQTLSALIGVGANEAARRLADRVVSDVPLHDPEPIVRVVESMDREHVDKAARSLAARIARNIPLHNVTAISQILYAMVSARGGRKADRLRMTRNANAYDEAARELATRAARQIPLANLDGVSGLLGMLNSLGAQDAAQILANRVTRDAAFENLPDPYSLRDLLSHMKEAGGVEVVHALVDRAAREMPVDKVHPVCTMLETMNQIGAAEENQILATRASRRVPVVTPRSGYDPGGIDRLLKALHETHNDEPARTLADRITDLTVLDNSRGIAQLLDAMKQTGFADAARRLADRAAHQVALDDPAGLAQLLKSIDETNSGSTAQVLAMRAAQHAPVDDPNSITTLVFQMQKMGAHRATQNLLERTAKRHFALYLSLAPRDQAERFRHGREPDETASPPWDWHSL